MKELLTVFYQKELAFVLVALFIGFLLITQCLEYGNDVAYNGGYICEDSRRGSLMEWVLRSFGVWFLLKVGQGIGGQVHNCADTCESPSGHRKPVSLIKHSPVREDLKERDPSYKE